MMRIYIAGKITNDPNYKRKFADAEMRLLENNAIEVINPAKVLSNLPESFTHEEYMAISFKLIDSSDAVVFLKDWFESPGANQEMGYAIAKEKTIYFVDEITTKS